MDYSWRSSSNYYDSQESKEDNNQDNYPIKLSKYIKAIILIIIFLFIFYKQPSNQNNQNIIDNPNKNNKKIKKDKEAIIPEKEITKAKESFQEFIYKDNIDTSKNLPYNLFIPEFIPGNEKIPLIIFINDAKPVGKESKYFLETLGSNIWATETWQNNHKCYALVPTYNEILIDNTNDYVKSCYLDITVRLIAFIKTKYNNIDGDRIYISGQGIGGMATMYLISNYPYIFAAGLIVGGNWKLDELKGLVNSTFTYIALINDKKSLNGQREIKNFFNSNDIRINYGSINNIILEENSDLINIYIYNMYNLGYRHNFITFSTNDNTYYDDAYNYGFGFKSVREWLFSQKMKNYDDYYKTKDGRLVRTKFCAKADKDNICKQCISGYYLSKDRKSCTLEKNCEKGDWGLGICIECINDFYFDVKEKKCFSNVDKFEYKFCKQVNEGICTLCEKYYFLDMNHKCSPSENCEESQNGKCIKCIQGYYMGLDNLCTNIEKCIYSKYGECIECQDGYYYDKVNKECKEYSSKYLNNCKYNSLFDETKCAACKDDYYLNRKQKICKSNTNKDKFFKCQISNDNGDACAFCVKDYFIGRIDKKCSLIQGCLKSKDELHCLVCDKDYCLDNFGECIYNYDITEINKKSIYRCNALDKSGKKCSKCEDDELEINEKGLCYDKVHCEKFEKGSCQKCQKENLKGYDSYCLNKEFGCIDSFHKNCLRCDDILNLNECTQCESGYELDKEGNCIQE